MKIAAIAFDYGGVICFPPKQESMAKVARLCGLSSGTLREYNRKFRDDWDRGVYSGIEFYKHILSMEKIFPDDETLFKIAQADMDCWKSINPATVQLMHDIKTTGLGLGILSNMPPDFLAWLRQNLTVINEADTAVFSCDYGVIKPETVIYEKLKNGFGCKYNEIVFFDDVIDNIAKAKELGIQGFVWEGAEAAREILKELTGKF